MKTKEDVLNEVELLFLHEKRKQSAQKAMQLYADQQTASYRAELKKKIEARKSELKSEQIGFYDTDGHFIGLENRIRECDEFIKLIDPTN